MENTRSNGLTALCVLSWIWMAIALLSVFSEINTGRLTEADIRTQKIVILESQTPETLETAPWIAEDSIEMLYISSDNYTAMVMINLVALLLGLAAVFLMFQMRKLGYHLYIIYSILSVSYWVYYFHELQLGWYFIALSAVFAILFVILYGTQVKKMT